MLLFSVVNVFVMVVPCCFTAQETVLIPMGAIPCYQIKGPLKPNSKGQIFLLPRIQNSVSVNQTQQSLIMAPAVNVGAPIAVGANPLLVANQAAPQKIVSIAAKPTAQVMSSQNNISQHSRIKPLAPKTISSSVTYLTPPFSIVSQPPRQLLPVQTISSVACGTSISQDSNGRSPSTLLNSSYDNVSAKSVAPDHNVEVSTENREVERPLSAICVVTPDGKVKAVTPDTIQSVEENLTSPSSFLKSDNALNSVKEKTGEVIIVENSKSNTSGKETQVGRKSLRKANSQEVAERLSAELRKLDPQERSIVELVRQLEAENESRSICASVETSYASTGETNTCKPGFLPITSSSPTNVSYQHASPDLEIPSISFSMITDNDYNENEDANDEKTDKASTRDVLLTTLLTPRTPKSGAYGYGLGLDLEELFLQTNPQEL